MYNENIMNKERTEIDLSAYKKRNQYHWFSTFDDPTYGFNVLIDVDRLFRYCKENKISFFIAFSYAILKGVNSVDEMKMRIVDGHVYRYEVIHPTFTVMTESGVYQNCGFEMEEDFSKYAEECRKTIEKAKSIEVGDELDVFPMCKEPNVVFMTSLPFLSIEGMNHPIPSGNPDNMSVPRIFFDKAKDRGHGRIEVLLNITVSHSVVDGFPLGKCFEAIQNNVNCIDYFKMQN